MADLATNRPGGDALSAEFLDYGTVSTADVLDLGSLRAVLPRLRLWPDTSRAELHARIRDAEVVLSGFAAWH